MQFFSIINLVNPSLNQVLNSHFTLDYYCCLNRQHMPVFLQMFPTALNASSRSGKLGMFASRRIRSGVFMESPPIMHPTIILWVCFENRTSSFATRRGSESDEGTAITKARS